jgi:hypothetical protein
MKKGEKALKYADLVWGKKVRRITLFLNPFHPCLTLHLNL